MQSLSNRRSSLSKERKNLAVLTLTDKPEGVLEVSSQDLASNNGDQQVRPVVVRAATPERGRLSPSPRVQSAAVTPRTPRSPRVQSDGMQKTPLLPRCDCPAHSRRNSLRINVELHVPTCPLFTFYECTHCGQLGFSHEEMDWLHSRRCPGVVSAVHTPRESFMVQPLSAGSESSQAGSPPSPFPPQAEPAVVVPRGRFFDALP